MRIVPAAPVLAKPTSVPAAPGHGSPTAIVCAALMLALVFLLLRITGVLGSPLFPDYSSIDGSVDGSSLTPEIRAS
jgi:hypothetical protein